MKILIGIGHPADVPFFRFFIGEMQRRGHAVVVAAREKDHACFLLDQFHIPYHLIAVHQKRLSKKIFDYQKAPYIPDLKDRVLRCVLIKRVLSG